MKQQHTLQPKLRFPEFKDELEIKLISNFANITTGNKDTQNKVENGKFPFFVRSNTIEKIDSYSFDGEAVLTAGDGVGVGKVFHYINDKFDFHQRVYAIYNFKNVSGKFFFQYFSEKFYNRVIKLSAKNSVDSVRKDFISNMPITLPSLPEQQKIADYLSTIDTKINLLEEKKAQLSLYKKAMMQKLFSQEIRFKDDKENDFPEWEEKILGEVLNVGNKIRVNNTKNYNKITIKLHLKGIEFSNINKEMADTRPFYVRELNEIIVGKQNYFNGSIAIVNEEFAGGICSNAIMSFSVKKDNVKFIYSFLSQSDYMKKREHLANGTGQKELSENDFLNFLIQIPSLPEQQKIADFLTAIDASIEKVTEQMSQTQSFKKAMLQGMFV